MSIDFLLRLVFFALVIALAAIKLPEARAKVLGSSVFRLDSVVSRGNRYLLDSQIFDIAGVEAGTCGFRYKASDIRSRLVRHPRIKSASVKRFLWKKIYIAVEERTPFALVHAQRLMEIDEERVVFEPVNTAMLPDLPVITGIQFGAISPGDTLRGREIEQAVALLKRLREPDVALLDRISEIHAESNGALTLVAARSGIPVLIGTEEVSTKKLQALRVALSDMQRRRLLPASVDLRFEGQIVAKVLGELPLERADAEGSDAITYALF